MACAHRKRAALKMENPMIRLIMCLCLIFGFVGCGKSDSSPATSPAPTSVRQGFAGAPAAAPASVAAPTPPAPVAPEPEPVAEPEPVREDPPPASLYEAIDKFKPEMSDSGSDDEISRGAYLLAIWGNTRLSLADIKSRQSTRFALVMKDPDEERGKRVCVSGKIIEIQTEKTDVGKFGFGGLYAGGNIYRFIAVGSSGSLVSMSNATFCGIVIGRKDYANSSGGTAHAVQLVGMFDIADNRR